MKKKKDNDASVTVSNFINLVDNVGVTADFV